ncbi:metallophosphoesterase family protein [Pseudobutyrivibrio sp.]
MKVWALLIIQNNTCYLSKDGEEEIFYNKNFKCEGTVYPIVPLEEMRWLQEELKDDMKSIIFLHHSFINDFPKRGINNREEIRKKFVKKQVLLCMNGHDHGDNYSIVDGIPYHSPDAVTQLHQVVFYVKIALYLWGRNI